MLTYGLLILLLIWLSHVAYYANLITLGTLSPLIKKEFSLNMAQIGILSSMINVGTVTAQIPAGFASDRYGVKKMLTFGLVIIFISALGISRSRSYMEMLLLFVLMGIGIACNQSPGTKAVVMWFSKRGRATAMGVKQTGVSVGGIVASLFLPALALQLGTWRMPFVLTGTFSLAVGAMVYLLYREGGPFLEKEKMTKFSLTLLRGQLSRNFLFLCLAGVLYLMVQFSFTTYFVLYATSVPEIPVKKASRLLALAFVCGTLARIIWGVLSDYLFHGKRVRVLKIISTFGTLCLLAFTIPSTLQSELFLDAATVVFGLTGLGWNAIYLTTVGEAASRDLSGTASGISFFSMSLGAIIGPPTFGLLIDMTGTYSIAWLFLAGCMVATIFLCSSEKEV